MEAIRIDLEEWEYYGEGGSSTSYIKKMDGNILLKLSNKNIPAITTEKEYLASKAFNEAGFPSPEIYSFVTDGERFGYTSQRIKGKISFARILSVEPGSKEYLASRFAAQALSLHHTPADTSKMTDVRKDLLATMGDLSYVPKDVADAVMKCFSSIGDDKTCLHGDMNPGNMISFEGKDYWIGVNEFNYGDPFLDLARMHIICNYLPQRTTKKLYHSDSKKLREFFTAFKKVYFGEEWNSEELESRIRNASIVKFCAAAKAKPEYIRILVPLVRGQRFRVLIRRLFT